MRDQSYLRASDADREQVAELLRHAHTEGRLDLDEFQERVERALSAKTYGELAAITGDLPGPGPQVVAARWPRRQKVPNWSRFAWVNALCWSVWGADSLTTSHHPGLWPLMVTGPWAAWRVSRVLERRRSRALSAPGGP